jgi:hypothetical protein
MAIKKMPPPPLRNPITSEYVATIWANWFSAIYGQFDGGFTHTKLGDMPDVDGTNTDHDARYVTKYQTTEPTTPPFVGEMWFDETEEPNQSLPGPQGDKGETGLQGIQGETGLIGPQGETGIQGISFNNDNFQVTETGALQMLVRNATGAFLSWGWLLKRDVSLYSNGVKLADEDCESVAGVSTGVTAPGATLWMTIAGPCEVRFEDTGGAAAGQYFGMANTGGGNQGLARATTNVMAQALGYVTTASSGAANIAYCYFTQPSRGISGYIYLNTTSFSDVTDFLCYYSKNGNSVNLEIHPKEGTSNASNFYLTDLPLFLTATNDSVIPVASYGAFKNNGSFTAWEGVTCLISSIFHRIEFELEGGWSATGTKGIGRTLQISYIVK